MASAEKDKEDETERHMRHVLEHEGFQVARIPSGPTRTADFRVSDDVHKYLIEVKRREDDPEMLARFDRDFNEKGEATRTEPGGRTSPMERIIRRAAKQLESTPTVAGEFKLIGFAAWGEDPELQMDQFRSTLYGEVSVLIAGAQGTIPCYYYDFNEFYNLRHIDGAIASCYHHSGFYINSFSPKAGALKQSKLFRMYDGAAAVCDPQALEARGAALIFDLDTDRREKAAVYCGLCEKYRFAPGEALPIEGPVITAQIGFTARIGS